MHSLYSLEKKGHGATISNCARTATSYTTRHPSLSDIEHKTCRTKSTSSADSFSWKTKRNNSGQPFLYIKCVGDLILLEDMAVYYQWYPLVLKFFVNDLWKY